MASLQKRKRKKGTAWIIQFKLGGKRVNIYLGVKYGKRIAEDVKWIVEKCASSLSTDTQLDGSAIAWIQSAPNDIKKRLVAAGLISLKRRPTIKELVDEYLSEIKSGLKVSTFSAKLNRLNKFLNKIIPDRYADEIKREDYELVFDEIESEFCQATRASVIKDVSACLNWATKKGYFQESPIQGIKRGSFKNAEREAYIDLKDYEKILAKCRTQDERAALSFYRIGGLRSGEALLVRWSDVNFEEGRLRITSPKTEKVGKGSRLIPLFPELAKELQSISKDGEFVLPSRERTFYYQAIKRAIKEAGLDLYPRLLQNLRASRAIEINKQFGWVAENEWLGHNREVARKHYLHTTREDFDKALMKD